MRASYLELYKEQIFDLLGSADSPQLQLREEPKRGVYVDGLTEVAVLNGMPSGYTDSQLIAYIWKYNILN